MVGINEHIEPLVGNENALSLKDLRQLLFDAKVKREELDSVLSDELLKCVDDFMVNKLVAEDVPEGSSVLTGELGRTEVYFWGTKGAGKTCVIGSLLAAQPEGVEGVNERDSLNRARTLIRIFNHKDTDMVLLPSASKVSKTSATGSNPSVVNFDLTDSNGHKHPLSLIEMANASVEQDILKQTANDKIHILCYDGTRAGVVQDTLFINLLSELKKAGVMEHSVGVYLLVTKIDALDNIPRDYQEEVAQTMITADHLDLWMAVKNVCYEMQILDATPIPYSIGDVKLQSAVVPNLQCASRLIDKPLALKSHPYRSTMGRVLRMGSWWSTAVLIGIACIALLYGVCLTASNLAPMPDDEIKPFDFRAYFDKLEAEQVKGGTYYRNHDKYDALRQMLKTESELRTKDGQRVLSARDYIQCDKALNNDFAEMLYGGMQYEFKQSSWNEGVLDRLRHESRELLSGTHLTSSKRSALNDAIATLDKYYNAKEIIGLSDACKTLDDVQTVKQSIEEYREPPFSNNTRLQQQLEGTLDKAYLSCARNTCDEAHQKYMDFMFEWERISFLDVSEMRDLRNRFLEECDPISSRIASLEDQTSGNEAVSGYLASAREWIDRIRNKRAFLE